MITLNDVRAVMAPRGLGAPFTTDPAFLQAWTQKLNEAAAVGDIPSVQYYQSLITENFGTPSSPMPTGVAAGDTGGGGGVLDTVSGLLRGILGSPVAAQAAQTAVAGAFGQRAPAATPPPPPAAPWTTGEKIAAGLLAVTAGGIIYAVTRPPRRRRR